MDKVISKNVLTRRDLLRTKNDIDVIGDAIFKITKYSPEEFLKNNVSGWLSTYIIDNCELKPKNIENFINNIEKSLDRFKILSLMISMEPSRGATTRLTSWVRANIDENIILDLQYSPKVYAGAIIEYNGNYLNSSLDKMIDNYFLENKAEILNKLSK